jgi:thiol-disulfide isomerase/thioredoxin
MRVKFFLLVASVLLSLAGVALYLDYKFSAKPTLMQSEGGVNTGIGSVTPTNTVDASAGAIYALSKVDQFGKSQSFAQWSGKLLVINFWATWCAPCLEEMPMFAQMQRTHALNGLQIIGIAADNTANVQSFSVKMKIDYPLFADEAGAIGFSKRLGNRLGLLPHTIAIAPNGQIVFNKMGKVTEAELLALVQSFGVAVKTKAL